MMKRRMRTWNVATMEKYQNAQNIYRVHDQRVMRQTFFPTDIK